MKMYITDLAAYNEGKLDGFWLDVEYSDEDEIVAAIEEFLEEQSEKYGVLREEYIVTDYDDIPTRFGEYPDIADIVEYLEQVDEYGKEVVEAALDTESDLDEYQGEYSSDVDFAEEYVESTGMFDGVSDNLLAYFDFERFAFDLMMDFNESNGHYFRCA